LLARYSQALDDDRLEAWPDFFTDNCRYLVTAADNPAQGMPLGMTYATSDAPRFVEKTVVLDSRQIDTLLAIPI
jgi:3-phenylpropionate/cinnamic acid dioxygenase small subunit